MIWVLINVLKELITQQFERLKLIIVHLFFTNVLLFIIVVCPNILTTTKQSNHCGLSICQDQATEVILTLGQAFEVAYQMALREGCSLNSRGANGHTRSRSVNQITSQQTMPPVTTQPQTNHSHSRSHSVNEIKVNGSVSPLSNGPTTPGRAPIVTSDDVWTPHYDNHRTVYPSYTAWRSCRHFLIIDLWSTNPCQLRGILKNLFVAVKTWRN